jgi:chitinase
MCYDYNGSWDKKIGANAPLTSKDFLNVEYTIEYLIELGAPVSKLAMGLPFYGRTFVTNEKEARLGVVSNEIGFPGPSTNENGFMGYNEICDALKKNGNDWKVEWDGESSEAIATMEDVNGTKAVVYDTTRSMANKVRYAIR